jgi:flagellum-specific ATP synthase
VTDTARGILDGHIVLSRKIANRNHYPSIDVLASVSRVMTDVAADEHKKVANEIKKSMAIYADAEDLINIGAYVKGSSVEIDDAIDKHPAIMDFLVQETHEKYSLDDAASIMKNILGANNSG